MGLRFLKGGAGTVLFPGQVRKGYSTVRNGWAATIAPQEGEVAVRYERGDENTFAAWVVGPEAEVEAWISGRKPELAVGLAIARAERNKAARVSTPDAPGYVVTSAPGAEIKVEEKQLSPVELRDLDFGRLPFPPQGAR